MSPTSQKKLRNSKSEETRPLTMEKHRKKERIRQHGINSLMRSLRKLVPSLGEGAHFKKIQVLQEVIRYIDYLQRVLTELLINSGVHCELLRQAPTPKVISSATEKHPEQSASSLSCDILNRIADDWAIDDDKYDDRRTELRADVMVVPLSPSLYSEDSPNCLDMMVPISPVLVTPSKNEQVMTLEDSQEVMWSSISSDSPESLLPTVLSFSPVSEGELSDTSLLAVPKINPNDGDKRMVKIKARKCLFGSQDKKLDDASSDEELWNKL